MTESRLVVFYIFVSGISDGILMFINSKTLSILHDMSKKLNSWLESDDMSEQQKQLIGICSFCTAVFNPEVLAQKHCRASAHRMSHIVVFLCYCLKAFQSHDAVRKHMKSAKAGGEWCSASDRGIIPDSFNTCFVADEFGFKFLVDYLFIKYPSYMKHMSTLQPIVFSRSTLRPGLCSYRPFFQLKDVSTKFKAKKVSKFLAAERKLTDTSTLLSNESPMTSTAPERLTGKQSHSDNPPKQISQKDELISKTDSGYRLRSSKAKSSRARRPTGKSRKKITDVFHSSTPIGNVARSSACSPDLSAIASVEPNNRPLIPVTSNLFSADDSNSTSIAANGPLNAKADHSIPDISDIESTKPLVSETKTCPATSSVDVKSDDSLPRSRSLSPVIRLTKCSRLENNSVLDQSANESVSNLPANESVLSQPEKKSVIKQQEEESLFIQSKNVSVRNQSETGPDHAKISPKAITESNTRAMLTEKYGQGAIKRKSDAVETFPVYNLGFYGRAMEPPVSNSVLQTKLIAARHSLIANNAPVTQIDALTVVIGDGLDYYEFSDGR